MAVDDWTTPGVEEVAPGVHRVPLPLPNDGLRAVNVYVLLGGERPVVVDSGWAIPEARELFGDALRKLGSGLADVERFLVTHLHRDHYGQALSLRREFGTRVTLGREEHWSLDTLRKPGRRTAEEQVAHLHALGALELAERLASRAGDHPDAEEWEAPDDWFEPGDIVDVGDRALEVVPTPGHTRGHVVFHDTAAGLLFAGDHVLPTITPSIGFEPALADDPLGDFLRSLALVRSRPDATLLPAHGAVTGSVHARVDELIEHHRDRLDAIEAEVRGGAGTAAEVAAKIPWTRRERRLDELDWFNQFLAISETGAHLELLAARSRISVERRDGIRHYTAS